MFEYYLMKKLEKVVAKILPPTFETRLGNEYT